MKKANRKIKKYKFIQNNIVIDRQQLDNAIKNGHFLHIQNYFQKIYLFL